LSMFVVRRAALREVGSQKQSNVAEFYEVCPDEANLHSASLSGGYRTKRIQASCHANLVPDA